MIDDSPQDLLRKIAEEIIDISNGRINSKVFVAICGGDSNILKTVLKGDISFLKSIISLIFSAFSTSKELNEKDRKLLISFILFKLFESSPELFKSSVSELIDNISEKNVSDMFQINVGTDTIH